MSRLRHKYSAVKTECDGIRFASKKEAAYYRKLKMLRQDGQVIQFLRQMPFHLPGNTRYVCDFLVFYADGTSAFIDVKGCETSEFKLKKKQVEALYAPIVIEVV